MWFLCRPLCLTLRLPCACAQLWWARDRDGAQTCTTPWAHRNTHELIHCVSRHRGAFLTNWQKQQRNVFCLPSPHHTAHQPSSVCSRLPHTAPLPSQPHCPRTRAGLPPHTARLAGRDETTKGCTQITISFIPAGQYLHSPQHKKLQALPGSVFKSGHRFQNSGAGLSNHKCQIVFQIPFEFFCLFPAFSRVTDLKNNLFLTVKSQVPMHSPKLTSWLLRKAQNITKPMVLHALGAL